jgi:hypothetical protein
MGWDVVTQISLGWLADVTSRAGIHFNFLFTSELLKTGSLPFTRCLLIKYW